MVYLGKCSLIGKILDCDFRCYGFESLHLPVRFVSNKVVDCFLTTPSTLRGFNVKFSVIFSNFYKESFLIDFTQKLILSRLLLNFVIVGPILLLLSNLNKVQVLFVKYVVLQPFNLIKLSANDSYLPSVLNSFICTSVLVTYL